MRILAGLLALCLIVGIAAGTSRVLANGGNADAGKAVYDKKCAACHGKTGEGNPALVKTLKVEFRHLGSAEVQKLTDAELKKIITEGTEKKKPVKGLTEEDLANVIAYLRTLKK